MLELTNRINNEITKNNMKIYTTTEYDYEIIHTENCKLENTNQDNKFEILDNLSDITHDITDNVTDNIDNNQEYIDNCINNSFSAIYIVLSNFICFSLNY
jgi:hypothetical protein